METFALRYFVDVAHHENIHRASESSGVSTASLSKAVAKLEAELGVKLFNRVGRNILLTDQGRSLQVRANEIIRLEEAARLEIGGGDGALRVIMAGPETLLASAGVKIVAQIQKRHKNASFDFQHGDDAQNLRSLAQGQVHMALTTSEVLPGYDSRVVAEVKFVTVVGKTHDLYRSAKARKVIAVEDVLKYAFVSTSTPLLGKVGARQSLDGWRDDQFRRLIAYRTASLKILEALVRGGHALAYLPDYLIRDEEMLGLKISGCPYTCTQRIKLIARQAKDVGWLNQLF